MTISGLQKTTLLDYPGHIACTVFLGGCNFSCPYCYNSSLICYKSNPIISQEEFFAFLEKRKGKFPIEYYLPAEIGSNPEKAESYVEVKISEKAAKRIKESLQKRLQSGKGENRSYMFLTTDPCYPELMNYTLGTDLNGDWTTYYRPLFSDDDKWKLLWQDFTLSETYQVLNADNMEADWEEQSDMWGTHTCP